MAKIIHDLTDISEVIAKRAAGKAVKFDIQAEANARYQRADALTAQQDIEAITEMHDVPLGPAKDNDRLTYAKFPFPVSIPGGLPAGTMVHINPRPYQITTKELRRTLEEFGANPGTQIRY